MSFMFRKMKRAKGDYLMILKTTYDVVTKKSSNKIFKTFGYVDDMKKEGIIDPITYVKKQVDDLNKTFQENKEVKVSYIDTPNKNVGYFLISNMFNTLGVDKHLNIMGRETNFHFTISEFIRFLTFAQIVNPCSKSKEANYVIPSLFNSPSLSEDQIYDGINFIGNNYKKYIELFNYFIDKVYPRNFKELYFDCTNYYFEIDLERDDLQKGPSKENRKEPIIGQALLLDANQIPLCMEMYPGNQSEKPMIRKMIEDMKVKNNINGRTIQVADKGLNCARNIYAASIEANDGYIFSKSVHGKNLSKLEKEWILLNNENNVWSDVKDINGNLIYKYKECIDVFEYKFTNEDGQHISFKVKEKRIVSYNHSLAKKQSIQIQKQIDKAIRLSTIKQTAKSDYGDSIKYVNFISTNNEGEQIEIFTSLNEDKINDDLKFAGYNLLVTSEINKSAEEIYNTYHSLWRIEESFRITKTQLQARPVYLQKRDSIYGHFLICYISLLMLRLLELKVFNDALPINQIVEYIRDFKVTQIGQNEFISTIKNSYTLQYIKEITGLSKLDNLHLSSSDINKFLSNSF